MATTDLIPDVESFLARHGMAESTFGRNAVNDWKLLTSLRRGRRVWPETEDRIRAFMAEHDDAILRDASVVVCDRSPVLQSKVGA